MNELRIKDFFSDLDPFESTFRQMMRPWRDAKLEAAPQIKLDVSESDADYTVTAEIPGVRKEDIDVRIDGNLVTLSAEVKKDSEEKKNGRVLRSERQYGYASRSFTLGSAVDDGKADAKYANGVLTLKLPKRAAETRKRLTIG
ncbi:MAG: Hsp20/alpha crystallin family protein [Burkholderiaceae bacterium]